MLLHEWELHGCGMTLIPLAYMGDGGVAFFP
jgi:hypothetical protein